jgi:hypothetical protein
LEGVLAEGREEMAIAAYWVTDGINCCRVGFLPCHMMRHAACYDGALSQVTRVFNVDIQPAGTPWSVVRFIKLKGVALQQ